MVEKIVDASTRSRNLYPTALPEIRQVVRALDQGEDLQLILL
ncbi:hypothetical protein [Pseudomonas sp. FEN]|nr:hypothetical protein [Pseudomonas sp. FEN]